MLVMLTVLIVLMAIGALVAIETSNLLYSIISIGAVGFLLSIVFLCLAAPDLAITQIAVEVITLVILLRAARGANRDVTERRSIVGSIAAVALVVGLGIFGLQMFADFPDFGSPVTERFADAPSNTYLKDGLAETGAANIVTAVLLDFRAYDTLGEATVLFCAVIGALTILRRKATKRPQEPDAEDLG